MIIYSVLFLIINMFGVISTGNYFSISMINDYDVNFVISRETFYYENGH